MEKIIKIGGNDVRFKCTALTPLIYKEQFGRDYMSDFIRFGKYAGSLDGDLTNMDPEDIDKIDFNVITQFAWACAKSANRDVPDLYHWLAENEEFDRMTDGMEVMNMISSTMETKKK